MSHKFDPSEQEIKYILNEEITAIEQRIKTFSRYKNISHSEFSKRRYAKIVNDYKLILNNLKNELKKI